MKAIPYLGVVLALAISGYASAAPGKPVHPVHDYRVRPDCGGAAGCYNTIQAALNASESDRSADWVRLDVAAGNYYEKPVIHRARTEIRGEGADRTRLYYDAVAQTAGHFHRDNWGTPGSATLTIDANQVTVSGLTVENSYDFLANDALPDSDPRKIANPQAVAVLADIHSDRVVFTHSALVGFQDTFFANGKRVLIRNSLISGNIDFIFGNGEVLIEDSTIRSRRRAGALAPNEFQSFVVAPSTPLSQPIGIVVYRSRLTHEDGVPDGSVALGRPWHPTTTFADGRYADPNAVGQASFIDCYMDAHIRQDHWTEMAGTAHDGTKTARFLPEDARFSEQGSTGPGAPHADIGIKWKGAMTIAQIQQAFFAGWSAN